MVEPLAAVPTISTAPFPLNVLAALKKPKRMPPPWNVFPLPTELTTLNRRKAARTRDLSVWEALGRLGRIFYSYADDAASDHLLVLALRQIHQDLTRTLPPRDRYAVIRFAFTPHDLWEGEPLYQFLQGLLITSTDRANDAMERVLVAILDEFYASYTLHG
ncbi:hypothetical protein DYB32_004696 [Aphanomyces invadans]|uniref:Uncharacterized protein n=1 Tax=Aphanomyces invadans TaxID=157072 RepID=A0A418AWV7_9STRA|nr:hypothetical protein DYB32_004696 [Aphanomyces invadans]